MHNSDGACTNSYYNDFKDGGFLRMFMYARMMRFATRLL
jgi:hypothetical protein